LTPEAWPAQVVVAIRLVRAAVAIKVVQVAAIRAVQAVAAKVVVAIVVAPAGEAVPHKVAAARAAPRDLAIDRSQRRMRLASAGAEQAGVTSALS